MAEKRKPITLMKTRGGAHQYGGENASKFQKALFKKYLDNPLIGSDTKEKMRRLEAAMFASDSPSRNYNPKEAEKELIRLANLDAKKRRKAAKIQSKKTKAK